MEKDKGKLIEIEYTEKGNVKLAVYKYYFSAVGLVAVLSTLLFYVGFQAFGIESSIWLGQWSEDTEIIVDGKTDTSLRNMYLYVYGALGLAQGIFFYCCMRITS